MTIPEEISPLLFAEMQIMASDEIAIGESIGEFQAGIAERYAGYGVVAVVAPADCSAADAHWKSAETLGILAGYEEHVKRFASCEFATQARGKIEALRPK